jgi:hypothetical protein
MPEGGEMRWEPDRPGRFTKPGGEVMLDMDMRAGRDHMEGKPLLALCSGGVVGSDW